MNPTITVLITILLSFLTIRINLQEDQLQVHLKRNWGYSSGTGKMQGTFTIISNGVNDLSRVIFYIDDRVLGEVNQEPFNLQFNTDAYSLGIHRLYAVSFTSENNQVTSNVLEVEFVSADVGWQAAMKIIVPIVVLALAVAGLAFLVPLIFTRNTKKYLAPGAPRNYGYYGGAICPNCRRPFSRHIYGLNLGIHKFDRCPYCGKWSLVKRASREELDAAEAAEIQSAQVSVFETVISREEKLQKEIEDSRFEDL